MLKAAVACFSEHTEAPDFVNRLISREVMEGELLRWEVKVSGVPAPTISWLRNGVPIPHCNEVQLVQVKRSEKQQMTVQNPSWTFKKV